MTDDVLQVKRLMVDPELARRVRALAQELANGIQEPEDVLNQLGFTPEDYEKLANERVFKELLSSYVAEWNAAGNTQKRSKLKAAIAVEDVIHELAAAIADRNEPLSSRSSAFLALMKAAGIGNPDPVSTQGAGNYFKLEIHLANRDETITVGFTPESIEDKSEESKNQSNLLENEPFQELDP